MNLLVFRFLENLKEVKRTELQKQVSELSGAEQQIQQQFEQERQKLSLPIQRKLQQAIQDVAKENGFSFILSQQIGGLDVILYGAEKMDVSDLVLKKLGVTPKPAAPAPAPK